mgnify:CR=1 FL=1|jgi:glycosyltransferase involved in cell wall biosynthesis
MHVIHTSPTYFGDRSIVGGGERYSFELARAMAEHVPTTFVSFAERSQSTHQGPLQVRLLPCPRFLLRRPLHACSLLLPMLVLKADIVHAHQFPVPATDIAILSALFRRATRVFLTDHGGATPYSLGHRLCIERLATGTLFVSEFSRRLWQEAGRWCKRSAVIYAGVDTKRFSPSPSHKARSGTVLYVGRLLPHKGVDYLIQAVDDQLRLEVVGRPYSPAYYTHLRRLANGKSVQFSTAVTDEELIEKYRRTSVVVLPSVYRDCYGNWHGNAELLGLTLLEAMACGTPVICTDVGGMPEVVVHGETGYIIPPNDPQALREALHAIADHPSTVARMGAAARQHILARFTWQHVVRRCLTYYTQY